MKIFKGILLIIFLIIILIYVTNITSIPDSVILFKGEELNLATVFGVNLNERALSYKTIETSSNIANYNKVDKKKVTVSLFNIIDIKNIEVNLIPEATIIPLGNSVGLKLYTSGVLVVGTTEIEGKKPYQNAGIEEGDMIVEVNKKEVTCTTELIENVNNSYGQKIDIKYIRDGEEYTSTIEPIKTKESEYKLGLWVRDRSSRNRNYKLL